SVQKINDKDVKQHVPSKRDLGGYTLKTTGKVSRNLGPSYVTLTATRKVICSTLQSFYASPLLSYDLKRGSLRNLMTRDSTFYFHATTYMESLVSLGVDNEAGKRTDFEASSRVNVVKCENLHGTVKLWNGQCVVEALRLVLGDVLV
ncbi:hypothetical protein IFM89_003924, partial [Coptis chinensis]